MGKMIANQFCKCNGFGAAWLAMLSHGLAVAFNFTSKNRACRGPAVADHHEQHRS